VNATVQAKITELVQAVVSSGAQPAEVIPALNAAYKDAIVAAEEGKDLPLPQMAGADLQRLLAYLNDGDAVDDIREVYRGLRQAVRDSNQRAFWRYLFMLAKSFRKQHPYLDLE
jgi:hypothetical protein